MTSTNETSLARRTCIQCDRPAVPGDSRCRPCILEEEACEAFWSVIVKHFPEAKFGDLSPERTIAQRLANSDAIAEWIDNNVFSQSSHGYCECEHGMENPSYMPDQLCTCGIQKHHYHCRVCFGVSQIG